MYSYKLRKLISVSNKIIFLNTGSLNLSRVGLPIHGMGGAQSPEIGGKRDSVTVLPFLGQIKYFLPSASWPFFISWHSLSPCPAIKFELLKRYQFSPAKAIKFNEFMAPNHHRNNFCKFSTNQLKLVSSSRANFHFV